VYPSALVELFASWTGHPFRLLALAEADLPGIAAVLTRYKTLNIQIAGSSLLHLANRERIDTVFTLDRRDFGVLRLAHGKKLRLIL
jgi:hypothetical protein